MVDGFTYWIGRQLKVIGRISSFRFKGQAEDLPAIGERLGAAYIMREAEGRSDRNIGLALAYHALGQRVESDVALDREKNNRGELSEVSVATVYAYRGEIDQAFNGLDKAVAARDGALGHKLEHEPPLAPLRSDPRYKALLKKMNLPE